MPYELDRDFALAECHELRAFVSKYVELVTTTERFALAGAAGFAAFSVSGATEEIVRARPLLSAIPFFVLSLAALRCLTFYLVIRSALLHIERIERAVLTDPVIGYQRNAAGGAGVPINRAIEAVSGGFWALAVAGSAVFWLLVNDFL